MLRLDSLAGFHSSPKKKKKRRMRQSKPHKTGEKTGQLTDRMFDGFFCSDVEKEKGGLSMRLLRAPP